MDNEGGCDENLEADMCASNNRRVTFAPRIRFLNSGHGGGCQPDAETNQELKAQDSSDTESSSLSNSSFDDLIQINTQILLKSSGENSISEPTVSTKQSDVNEKCIDTSEAFNRLEESVNEYPESTSQSSDVIHESARDYMLPTLSPSIQTMEWPEDFNHPGVGASHSSSCSIPMEGSSASDDSLFSIHFEENREDAFRTDLDLYKSEKWPKTGELCQSGAEPSRKSGTAKTNGEDVKSREREMVDESINNVSKSPKNNPFDTNVGASRDSSCANDQSDKVETSIPPLAPSVKKKSQRSLCHCPDFCSAFHCFKWPGCSIKCSWLGYCCKRPSCYCKRPIWSSFRCSGCLINCSWLGYCCKRPSCFSKCPIWSCCCVKHNN